MDGVDLEVVLVHFPCYLGGKGNATQHGRMMHLRVFFIYA